METTIQGLGFNIFPNGFHKGPYMGGCQNYGPFLDPYYNTAPNIWGTQKGTIILTTTHLLMFLKGF